MNSYLRVLIIEDSEDDTDLLVRELRRNGYDLTYERVEDAAAMQAALAQQSWDIVFNDYTMPRFGATAALALLRESGLDLPFIITSGTVSEDIAAAAMQEGTAVYLLKDRLSQLGTAVTRALSEKRLRDEKRAAEEALLASEARFRAMIEKSADGIALISPDGTVLYESPSASRFFGLAPENLVGDNIFEWLHPEDVKPATALFGPLLEQSGGSVTNVYRFSHADGSWHWIEATVTNLLSDPNIQAIVVNYRDVTERIQAEAALMENEQRFRALTEHAPDGIILYGLGGRIEYSSPATSRILGYLPDEIVNTDPAQITHPADRPDLLLALNELRQTPGKTVTTQHRMQHKDGSWRWIESIVSNCSDVLGIKGLVFNYRDITARRQAEAALRQSETQLQYVIDTVPEGVLLLAADGSVRLTNPMAERFLTLLAPEWRNGRLTHLGNRPLNELLTSPPTGLWHEIAIGDHTFEAIARPVEDSPDNGGWVLALRDVTQEREIQQRVQQQERLAAVGQLAAGITHDFSNVMTVITLSAQLISRTMEMPPKIKERLRTIEQQAKRAADLTRQILDFSRQSVLERRPLDLLPFMEELVQLLDRTLPEDIQIGLTSAGEEFLIQADPSRIQQVMMNLAVNARDAMPEGGQFQIRLAHVQTEKYQPLSVQDMPPGDWVQVQVADSGSGIPPEVLPQIFEPFFTTKEVGQGTGLGLAQVYGIVQQHEGYIDVATEVGRGTTFTLYFPILDTDERVTVTHDNASLQKGQGQTVLVVEDHLATRQALVGSLVFLNYEVIEATNGREALTILASRANEIDLVLSDVVMPEMGGIALLHAMKQQNLAVPMVLLTGHPLSNELEDLRTLGLVDWLPKPPDLANLSLLLVQALSGESH